MWLFNSGGGLGLLALGLNGLLNVNAFSPSSYPQKVANCHAFNRVQNESHPLDIKLHYVEVNPEAETTIIMAHGWPSLWSTWSNQIEEFKDDYHLIAPDLRGFGSSTHPDDVQSSGTMYDIAGDLVCILQHAGVKEAICLGHDWGAQVCYEAARIRPDVFKAVIGLVIPYIPSAGPFMPIAQMAKNFPALSYQLFFEDHTPEAILELEKNTTRTLRATMRTVDSPPPEGFLKSDHSYLAPYDHIDPIPPVPFFTAEEEDYLVEQYAIQGFRNTLQFYTVGNKYLSWKFAHDQGNITIPQPALSIIPYHDPVANWTIAAVALRSAEFLPNLKTVTLEGAHWIHLENPKHTNEAIREWLNELPKEVKSGGGAKGRAKDEL